MALTKAKLEELIAAGEIEVGGGGVNANILHNSDFRNPINQRGVSGAISTGSYFFDRWIRNSGTVTVAAGYLAMASGAVIEQRIEGLYLAGATVTLSVRVGSTIYGGTDVFPAVAGTVDITLTGFGTATLGYNAGYMFVHFTASGSQNVVAVKCELGTVSTLHLDPPMDYGTELAKCQRYFEYIGSGAHMFGETESSSGGYLMLTTSQPMRNSITPSISDGDFYANIAGGGYPITVSVVRVMGQSNKILLAFTGSGLPANYPVVAAIGTNFFVSSDL